MHLHPNSSVLRTALIFALSLAVFPSASAQLIKVEAGVSTLVPSEGGSVGFQSKNYNGYLGAGEINGSFRMGVLLNTTVGPYKLVAGDDPIQFGLPTDIFSISHYFIARGVGVRTQRRKMKILAFMGKNAFARGVPFFQAATPEQSMGLLFFDVPFSDRLHFYSRNIVSKRQTSIQGLDWRPQKWLKTGVAAGIGSNQRYFATSFDAERDHISIKAGYISAGDHFRRITVNSPLITEVNRENVLVTVRPKQNLELLAGRQNYLEPQLDLKSPFLHATVNQVQASYEVAQLRFGGGTFNSTVQGRHNLAEAFWASRPITRRVNAGFSFLRSQSHGSPATNTLSFNVREVISPKLTLLQLINRSQGSTNILFGGSYITNRFNIGVDYTTLYLPFRANPFKQALGLNLQVKLFGGVQLNTQSFVGADGKVRYTVSGNTQLVHGFHLFGGAPEVFKFPKYVVRGRVLDENGAPIEGAALRIDNEMTTTNSAGQFLVRKKKAGVFSLEIVWDEFLNPVPREIVSAPKTVVAAPEDSYQEVLIVLRRARVSPKP